MAVSLISVAKTKLYKYSIISKQKQIICMSCLFISQR